MKPLVSIVTLTYKKFDKLYQAIDSVMKQDYSRIEYIISDDGSPDFPENEIWAYIAEHSKANIEKVKIVSHKENVGTVKNINDAYRHVSGEFIIHVSADDALMDSTVVNKIVAVFEERKCSALMTTRALYNEDGDFVKNIPSKKEARILSSLKNNREQYQIFVTGRFYGAYSGSTLALRKNMITSHSLYDEKYKLLEDGPFFQRYLWENYMECAFDIVSIRYNEGGVSTGNKHPLLLEDDKLFRETDRIAHIKDLTWFQQELVLYDVARAKDLSRRGRISAAILHPIGFIGMKIYRLSLRFLKD